MKRYPPLVPVLALAVTMSCVRSDPVAAEPVYWSCRVAPEAAPAADFCPAIGAAFQTALEERDPGRAVAPLAAGSAAGSAAGGADLDLIIEIVSAGKRSLSSRLVWRRAGMSEDEAGPVLTLDVTDRSLYDADLRATLASQIADTLLSHGGAPL